MMAYMLLWTWNNLSTHRSALVKLALTSCHAQSNGTGLTGGALVEHQSFELLTSVSVTIPPYQIFSQKLFSLFFELLTSLTSVTSVSSVVNDPPSQMNQPLLVTPYLDPVMLRHNSKRLSLRGYYGRPDFCIVICHAM